MNNQYHRLADAYSYQPLPDAHNAVATGGFSPRTDYLSFSQYGTTRHSSSPLWLSASATNSVLLLFKDILSGIDPDSSTTKRNAAGILTSVPDLPSIPPGSGNRSLDHSSAHDDRHYNTARHGFRYFCDVLWSLSQRFESNCQKARSTASG